MATRLSGTGNTSITASFPTSIAGLTLAAGTLTVTPGVKFSGMMEWTGGTIAGTLVIPSGSVLNVTGTGAKDLYNDAVLNNAGTINWGGAFLRGLGVLKSERSKGVRAAP